MKNFDYVVVGSGIFGSVISRELANAGYKVLVVERRNHIGGNCHSYKSQYSNIEVHKYGTHIFHTNNESVWKYITKFTSFNNYRHQVLTLSNNRVYQMPINLETINSFYQKNLSPEEAKEFLSGVIAASKIAHPKNLEEQAISLIGEDLYRAFIRGYTLKQWQKDPKELPASIIKRLPMRYNYNEDYFLNSKYQGIPVDGYTEIFNRLLEHENIEVKVNCDYFEFRKSHQPKLGTIYSGPIDRYFDYKHGKLEWRSIRLEEESHKVADFQGTSVMNYADETVPFTRIHEYKHLHPERTTSFEAKETVIFREYSEYNPKEPFYPIRNESNMKIFEKYTEMATQEKDVTFGGRLGSYAYYDMDASIAAALAVAQKLLKSQSHKIAA